MMEEEWIGRIYPMEVVFKSDAMPCHAPLIQSIGYCMHDQGVEGAICKTPDPSTKDFIMQQTMLRCANMLLGYKLSCSLPYMGRIKE